VLLQYKFQLTLHLTYVHILKLRSELFTHLYPVEKQTANKILSHTLSVCRKFDNLTSIFAWPILNLNYNYCAGGGGGGAR
jgi:hypothetical protein